MDTVDGEVRRRAGPAVSENERIAFISIKTETKDRGYPNQTMNGGLEADWVRVSHRDVVRIGSGFEAGIEEMKLSVRFCLSMAD
jgi:hypothetical protein